MLLGVGVCKKAFLSLTKIGNAKLWKLVKAIKAGDTAPPRDLRHERVKPSTQQASECSRWLQKQYDDAEFLAEEEVDEELCSIKSIRGAPPVSTLSEWVVGPGSTVQITSAATGVIRRLQCESFIDFYQRFVHYCETERNIPDHNIPSLSTLQRMYDLDFSHCLKFRKASQHAKCALCCKYKEWLRKANSVEDVKLCSKAYRAHLGHITGIRKCDELICGHAEDYAAGKTRLGSGTLRIHQDIADQAKFKVGKHISPSKEFQNLWRPQLALMGCLCFGFAENYFLLDPDIKIDANCECTCLDRSIELCVAEASNRTLAMPPIL